MPKELSVGEKLFKTILRAELKNFVTKESVKNFSTKDDLKNFATKDDLKTLSTRIDLKIYEIKEELKDFATKEEMRTQHNEVMNTLDEMYGIMKEMKQEMAVANNRVYKVHDPKLENHEKRITKLEVQAA